jgi:hypothetical protein
MDDDLPAELLEQVLRAYEGDDAVNPDGVSAQELEAAAAASDEELSNPDRIAFSKAAKVSLLCAGLIKPCHHHL